MIEAFEQAGTKFDQSDSYDKFRQRSNIAFDPAQSEDPDVFSERDPSKLDNYNTQDERNRTKKSLDNLNPLNNPVFHNTEYDIYDNELGRRPNIQEYKEI